MAKKNEYPESRSMVARVECIANALITTTGILSSIESHGLKHMPETMRGILAQQIADCKQSLAMARAAMSGNDGEDN